MNLNGQNNAKSTRLKRIVNTFNLFRGWSIIIPSCQISLSWEHRKFPTPKERATTWPWTVRSRPIHKSQWSHGAKMAPSSICRLVALAVIRLGTLPFWAWRFIPWHSQTLGITSARPQIQRVEQWAASSVWRFSVSVPWALLSWTFTFSILSVSTIVCKSSWFVFCSSISCQSKVTFGIETTF
jgi:hypothetical protein